jgi:hypothetical protein
MGGVRSFYKAFTPSLPHPYRAGFLLKMSASLQRYPCSSRAAYWEAGKAFPMPAPALEIDVFLGLLTALSVAFLLWALWNFSKYSGRR